MRNYITYNGVDLREFGLYISGQGAFNSPARDYEQIVIPGRDGVLLGKEDKLNATELTYRGFIYKDFRENVAKLRAFLLSNKGFFRLTDTYNPDEYRLALYEGELIVEPTAKNNAGEFDLTFLVQPQRYLLSGEVITTMDAADPPSETYSGEIVTFEDPDGDKTIQSLTAQISPVQDLHGYDHPWPAGGGKNLADESTVRPFASTSTVVYNQQDETISVSGSVAYAAGQINVQLQAGVTYAFSVHVIQATAQTRFGLRRATSGQIIASDTNYATSDSDLSFTFTPTEDMACRITLFSAYSKANDETAIFSEVQCEVGSAPTSYAPYKNLCPISGWTGVEAVVSPTQDAQDDNTYSVSWETAAGTVYNGEINLTTGVLTVKSKRYNLDDPNVPCSYRSNYGYFRYTISEAYDPTWDMSRGLPDICTCYKTFCPASGSVANIPDMSFVSRWANTGGNYFVIKDTRYTDVASLRAALAGQYAIITIPDFTVQLTPTQISTLLDQNNIWADTGDVTVVVVSPFSIENPTLFDAKPLLRVYGSGTVGIGEYTFTISEADEYTDIDCEMMDCFKGAVNKNPYVTFSNYEFPVLVPGVNKITMGAGITKIEITPRWYSV